MKVYVVWGGEESSCDCSESGRSLSAIYTDKKLADEHAKRVWQGYVDEWVMLVPDPFQRY